MVSFASHLASFVAFTVFAGLLCLADNRRGAAALLILACAVTAAWSAAVAASSYSGTVRAPELIAETLRNAAWIAFLYRLLIGTMGQPGDARPGVLKLLLGAYLLSLLAADTLVAMGGTASPLLFRYAVIGRVIAPIIGLTLIENLARNDWTRAQWWARFLFVGLGGMFAYDLFLYSEALLFQHIDEELYAARGAVYAIAVPLMAISFARSRQLAVDIHVSRQFVFHTMTLAGAGIYLLLMAGAGYYLRDFGGTWGTLLQVLFLATALALAFLTLSSGAFRSAVRNFVAAHFFSNKYDYRLEWLRFIGIISAQESLLPLHDRVVQAIANIVDCPSASLWVHREEDDAFVNTASWNAALARELQSLPAALAEAFEGEGRIIEAAAAGAESPALPGWLAAFPKLWIVVPLIHRTRLCGLLVLARPRAPRRLDAEDIELLRTAGRQAASYIAEEAAGRALMTARQLEVFNQRFAFVVHDIKNLVSQLSLILSNAARHGDNPEFQKDVIATVDHSVTRMKELLEQIGQTRRSATVVAPFDIVQVIRRDWQDRGLRDPRLHLSLPASCLVSGEAETISQVLRHLVENAFDAIGADGRVELRVLAEASSAAVVVIDDGSGMSPEFIRDKLFQPFDSSKKSGYGIGAYQARELVRRMGGRLEVLSTPGSGTEVRIHLPLVESSAAAMRQVQDA